MSRDDLTVQLLLRGDSDYESALVQNSGCFGCIKVLRTCRRNNKRGYSKTSTEDSLLTVSPEALTRLIRGKSASIKLFLDREKPATRVSLYHNFFLCVFPNLAFDEFKNFLEFVLVRELQYTDCRESGVYTGDSSNPLGVFISLYLQSATSLHSRQSFLDNVFRRPAFSRASKLNVIVIARELILEASAHVVDPGISIICKSLARNSSDRRNITVFFFLRFLNPGVVMYNPPNCERSVMVDVARLLQRLANNSDGVQGRPSSNLVAFGIQDFQKVIDTQINGISPSCI